MPRAILYFLSTLGRPSMVASLRRLRFRLVFMWALRCRRPTFAWVSLSLAVILIRFFTLLLVLFFLAMFASNSCGGSRWEGWEARRLKTLAARRRKRKRRG